MNEIIQGTCDHEQEAGLWTDLLGKPMVEEKAEKEVAANQTEKKNPKRLGGNQEREICPKSQGKSS